MVWRPGRLGTHNRLRRRRHVRSRIAPESACLALAAIALAFFGGTLAARAGVVSAKRSHEGRGWFVS
jgi:hypothetical protein